MTRTWILNYACPTSQLAGFLYMHDDGVLLHNTNNTFFSSEVKIMKASTAWLVSALSCVGSAALVEQHPIGSVSSGRASSVSSKAPSYRDDLLSLHKSLVDITSISGTENKVGSFLVDYLGERDYVVQLQFLPPSSNTPDGAERFNVVAWPGPTRNPKPRVLVSSHIDTVPPYIPYSIDAKGSDINDKTLISGRGSVDAKASVAAQIFAVEELLKAKDLEPKDVMLLFVVGEETTGDGMKFFSSSLAKLDPPPKFEAGIFGEPTELKLACGHKGVALGKITAQGKAAHSGYPWLGKSAIEVLARALVKIVDTDLGTSKRFGNTTANIGMINGGVANNVVAKNASASVAIRLAAGNETTGAEFVRQKLAKILKEVDDEALSMEFVAGYGPVETNCEVDGFEKIIVNYGTDVPNLKGNHTRYLYGPGSILVAHGDNEAITVGDLEASVEGYKKLIKYALKQ